MNRLLLDDSIRKAKYDNDIIQASANRIYYSATNLSNAETEVLNISGEGVVQGIFVYAPTGTTMVKVYIDDVLYFNFGRSAGSTGYSGIVFGRNGYDFLSDLRPFISGTTIPNGVNVPNVLSFGRNLKIMAHSTVSDSDHKINIQYGLVG